MKYSYVGGKYMYFMTANTQPLHGAGDYGTPTTAI
jgi:hypothetical protein